MSTLLIFPSSISESLDFYQKNGHKYSSVVASSSLAYDTTAHHFKKWTPLPFIHEETFIDQLKKNLAIDLEDLRKIQIEKP